MTLFTYLNHLSGLSQAEWEVAQPLFQTENVRKGAFYLESGAVPDKVSFVVSGLFRLFYVLDGEEKIMLFFTENQFMTDYFGLLTQTPSLRPIQALEDSEVLSISRSDFMGLFDQSKAWERIGRLMAEWSYVYSVQRANRLLHDDYDTRLRTFMHESPSLMQRIPQYMIASYLNMTPETLSRIKRRLRYSSNEKDSVHRRI